jgi:hypothetical protein
MWQLFQVQYGRMSSITAKHSKLYTLQLACDKQCLQEPQEVGCDRDGVRRKTSIFTPSVSIGFEFCVLETHIFVF